MTYTKEQTQQYNKDWYEQHKEEIRKRNLLRYYKKKAELEEKIAKGEIPPKVKKPVGRPRKYNFDGTSLVEIQG